MQNVCIVAFLCDEALSLQPINERKILLCLRGLVAKFDAFTYLFHFNKP